MSREILSPELLWVGGRDYCYRLNPLSDAGGSDQGRQLRPVGQLEEDDEEEEEVAVAAEEAAEAAAGGCTASGRTGPTSSSSVAAAAAASAVAEIEDQLSGCHIETISGGGGRGGGGGGFRMILPVPSAFHRYLIGRHGDAKRRLEAETGVELRIPRMGDTESPVLVLARTRAQLASARTRLDLLLGHARDRLPITHFLSLCVASEPVAAAFAEFRDAALRWCGGDRGVTEGVFQHPSRLHVTCAPLLLLTAPDVARARRMLDEFAAQELPRLLDSQGSGPLRVSLRGLEIMNDDPTDCRIVFARVDDPSGRLQTLADALLAKFAPLAKNQPGRTGVKLHVTLLNAKYVSDDAAPGSEQRPWASFDASHLLAKFGNVEFGSATLDSVQLSKASHGAAAKDAYYACEHKVPLA